MTAIKDEYISDDIVRSDLLPISFLEKSPYTGSKGGLRFRLPHPVSGDLWAAAAAAGTADGPSGPDNDVKLLLST